MEDGPENLLFHEVKSNDLACREGLRWRHFRFLLLSLTLEHRTLAFLFVLFGVCYSVLFKL